MAKKDFSPTKDAHLVVIAFLGVLAGFFNPGLNIIGQQEGTKGCKQELSSAANEN